MFLPCCFSDGRSWIDEDGYILQNKFREWMESALTKAFNNLPEPEDGTSEGNTRILRIEKDNSELEYKVSTFQVYGFIICSLWFGELTFVYMFIKRCVKCNMKPSDILVTSSVL